MSEHKTSQTNLTDEEKKLYRDRRDKGLRGQIATATVHRAITDENGDVQHVPIGTSMPSMLSRGKTAGARAEKRRQWMAFRRAERKGSARGN